MSEWIGRTFTSDTGWNHLETLVDIRDRMAGTDGERAAADATRDALAAFCDDVWLDEFDVQGWERETARVEAAGETFDERDEVIALPRSPAIAATGEFVDVGFGLPADFESADVEGRVVMVDSNVPSWFDRHIHRREKYYHAVEGGAVAFVYKNHVEGCLPPTGSVGKAADPIGAIPAVGVSKETGARLARRATGTPVTVDVDAHIADATSQNVHGVLGPDTAEEVLVTSHVDAHDIAEGAMDNGAGTAMVVEVARILAERANELDTRVHVIAFGSEEVGLAGAAFDAATRDLDAITTVLNFDGVVRGRTLKFYTHAFDALQDAAEAIGERYGHPITTTPEQGPHSDHWEYVKWGVPGYHVVSETGDAGRGWGHTHADTLDKLEKRDLREQAILLADLAVDLAADEFTVAHASTDDIAAALEREDLAEGMRITGDWPY
jgi:Zn-dependent M28 family amino/carboxypeptidase